MLNIFKIKNKMELTHIKTSDEFSEEHIYKMTHDAEYRASLEQSSAFFKADKEAREKAELTNLPGTYHFKCPNCGSDCEGSWNALYGMDNLHGYTGCQTCNIYLVV